MKSPLENHHIIPQEILPGGRKAHAIFDTPGLLEVFNGESKTYNKMGLPWNYEGVFQKHHLAHAGYTDWVVEQLDSIYAKNLSDPVEVRNQLIGLTNVIKINFANPEFNARLNGDVREEIYKEWAETLNFEDYTGENGLPDDPNKRMSVEAFQAGSQMGLSFSVAQNGDFNLHNVDGNSPFNTFKYDTVDPAAQSEKLRKLVRELEFVRANLPADYDAGDPVKRETAAKAVNFLNNGADREQVRAALNGEVDFVEVKGGDGKPVVLFSPAGAAALTFALDGLGAGSTLVDMASLSLIGYGLKESGAIPEDASVGDLVGMLAQSNVSSAVIGQLDNLAFDIGREIVLSGVATALGVGLLWKGYEVYQSLDGLRGAIAFADERGSSTALAEINRLLDAAGKYFDNDAADYTQAEAMAGIFAEGLEPVDQGWVIEALRTKLIYEGLGAHIGVTSRDQEYFEKLLGLLQDQADRSDASFDEMLAAALSSHQMIADDPKLLATIAPDHCFAAGTLVTMWDGRETPIEAVLPGDQVLAFDAAGRRVAGDVVRLFRQPTQDWLELTFADGAAPLTVTPGHRFLTQTGDYACIGDLVRGGGTARLVRSDGTPVEVTARAIAYGAATADRYEAAETGWRTYNFEVAEHQNYVAGGVRVHNHSILHFLTPAERANVVEVRGDTPGRPDFAVVQIPGENREIQYALGTDGTYATVETTFSDGAGNMMYQVSVRDAEGNIVSAEEARHLEGQSQGGTVASSLTPFLTSAFLDEDAGVFTQVAGETVVGTVLHNLGEVVGGTIHREVVDIEQMHLETQVETAQQISFEDLGGELVVNATDAVISVVNQMILTEVFEASEIDSAPGAVLNASLNAGMTNVVGNGLDWLFDQEATVTLFETVGFSDASINTITSHEFGNVFGGEGLGTNIASLAFTAVINEVLPALETLEGQIASTITTTALAVFGALSQLGAAAGPVGATIGWVVGMFFDTLFGGDDPDPEAWTNVGFDEETGRFVLLDTWSEDGGDEELSQDLAQAYVDGMNGFIDTIMSQSHNYDEIAQWSFGHYEDAIKNAGKSGATFEDFHEAYLDAYVRDLGNARPLDGQMVAVRALEAIDVNLRLGLHQHPEALLDILKMQNASADDYGAVLSELAGKEITDFQPS